MFHFYAYSKTSKQFMLLTPAQAKIVNDFTDIFFEAQEHFVETYGRPWTGSEPIKFREGFDMEKYNKVASFLNHQHAIRNFIFKILKIDVSKEIFDDYLIRRF